jgi:purine-nucleoside phosphorylase
MLNGKLRAIASSNNIALHEGVYVSVPGPNLETRAEYRMLKMFGADAVGMSTVPEVIACNHMSLPCCCVSVITDTCDPSNLSKLSVEEIIATARQAESKLNILYKELIAQL